MPHPLRPAAPLLHRARLAVAFAAMLAVACGPDAVRGQPLGAAAEPPPLYIGQPPLEPLPDTGFAGMPVPMAPMKMAIDDVPAWPRWFFGAGGLVMTRTLPGGAATMEPLGGVQLTTAAAGATWPGGVDLHLGRWFGPEQHHAVEAIYWGVYGIGSSASVAADPALIMAIPQAPGIEVGDLTADAYLDNASSQRISRADVINDVEINWVYSLWDRPEFLPRQRSVNLMWLAGFRFFQVNDTLTLVTTAGDPSLGGLDLDVATNNNLYGGQVGAKFDWRFLPRLRFNVVPKFMIGGNAISNKTTLATDTGTSATFPDGDPVAVRSTLGVFAWLGSVDTGLAWDVTDHWSLSMGYRVVGVGNIAQADGQWPTLIATPASLSGLDAGSSTIIHGGFAGFEGRY
jgi:hypothetical protein